MILLLGKVAGEYKEFGYEIDKDCNVIVSEKLKGEKPTGYAEVITRTGDLEEVEILVEGSLLDGEIEKIEALDGAELKEKKNSGKYIFVVRDNKSYSFRIRGNNGRGITVSCNVDNAIPVRDDLITAVAKINGSGVRKVKIFGKTNPDAPDEEKIYSLNVIYHNRNMVFDGYSKFDGATLDGTTYEFGNSEQDVATKDEDAKNMVVLKVNGDIIVNSGVTVTSVKSKEGYGGPKGFFIYCTGTITNNGEISMTKRGARANGENVYLYKVVEDNKFEFVPAFGGDGRRRCISRLQWTFYRW